MPPEGRKRPADSENVRSGVSLCHRLRGVAGVEGSVESRRDRRSRSRADDSVPESDVRVNRRDRGGG